MNKTLILIACILSIAFIGNTLIRNSYYKRENEADIVRIRKMESEERARVQNCLRTALANYKFSWGNECTAKGMATNCQLPYKSADSFNKVLDADRNRCYK